MNAQTIYMMGDGSGLTWDSFPGKEITLGSDGYYTAQFTSLNSFKISTNKSSGWDGDNQFNAGAYQLASGSFGDAVYSTTGQTLSLAPGSANNIDTPWDGAYTVKVKSDMSSITLITTTPKPTNAPDAYIVGGMNGWGINASWKMSVSESGSNYVYTLENCTINANVEFKIAGANGTAVNWGGAINYGTGSTIAATQLNGTPISITYNGNNMKLGAAFNGTVTLTIPQTAKQNGTISFTPSGSKVEYPENLYVLGNVNGKGWDPTNAFALTTKDRENGLYEGEVAIGGEMGTSFGYFSFCTSVSSSSSDWSGVGTRYGATTSDFPIEIGVAAELTSGENSFKVTEGTYNFSVNLKDMTVTLTSNGTPEPTYPETLYLIGNANGWNINDDSLEFTNEGDGIFTLEGVSMEPADGSESSYFTLYTELGDFDANYYGAPQANEADGNFKVDSEFTVKEEVELPIAKNKVSWIVAKGTYDITVNFEDMMMILVRTSIETGITNISADENAPVEYFNLQGVRVANPENGIFIVRQGSKVTKVIR